jgi:hypothetical protein
MLSKTYKQTVETDTFLIGTDADSPPNETVAQLAGDNIDRKFLSFSMGQATLEYWVKAGPVTLSGGLIAGANDTKVFPEREAVHMVISNEDELRSVKLPQGLAFKDHGVFPIGPITGQRFFVTLENRTVGTKTGKNRILQCGPLVFPEMGDARFPELFEDTPVPVPPQPIPDPTPELSAVITYPVFTGRQVSLQVTPDRGLEPCSFSLRGEPWLKVEESGKLTGTPLSPGVFTFTVTLVDADGLRDTVLFRLDVRNPAIRHTLTVNETGHLDIIST